MYYMTYSFSFLVFDMSSSPGTDVEFMRAPVQRLVKWAKSEKHVKSRLILTASKN